MFMLIEDYDLNICKFKELLQKFTENIANGFFSENLSSSELWKRSKEHVTTLVDLTKNLSEIMLILKPEKAKTVKNRTETCNV